MPLSACQAPITRTGNCSPSPGRQFFHRCGESRGGEHVRNYSVCCSISSRCEKAAMSGATHVRTVDVVKITASLGKFKRARFCCFWLSGDDRASWGTLVFSAANTTYITGYVLGNLLEALSYSLHRCWTRQVSGDIRLRLLIVRASATVRLMRLFCQHGCKGTLQYWEHCHSQCPPE